MDGPPVEFVARSEVRSSVLRALAEEPRRAPALVEALDASESAVYEALGSLRERQYATEEDAWRATGLGRVVVDALERRSRTERMLRADPDYWRTHDVTALPKRFRRTLPAIADCEVRRADDADPNRIVRLVASRVADSERVDVLSPVYHERYAAAVRETEATRLVLDRSVVEAVGGSGSESEPPDNVEFRLDGLSFALAVTDGELLLSLPTTAGEYDARTEVLATDEAAREWGRRLFEHCWSRAETVTVP